MKETMEEAIVLLNDGETSNEEGYCNSWPNIPDYPLFWDLYPESCVPIP